MHRLTAPVLLYGRLRGYLSIQPSRELAMLCRNTPELDVPPLSGLGCGGPSEIVAVTYIMYRLCEYYLELHEAQSHLTIVKINELLPGIAR